MSTLSTNLLDAQNSQHAHVHASDDTFIMHMETFSKLSVEEKWFVLERVRRSFEKDSKRNQNADTDVNQRISDLLKENAYDGIDKAFYVDDSTSLQNSDALIKVSETIGKLLRPSPDEKYTLNMAFNSPLPKSIRFVTWYAYLYNNEFYNKFLENLAVHPQAVLYPMDSQIHLRFIKLVKTLPCAVDIRDSKDKLGLMEPVLSYYRALYPDNHHLTDEQFYYLVPIVLAQNLTFSRHDTSHQTLLTLAVEMYQTLSTTMPTILRNPQTNDSIDDFEPWFRKVEYHLQNTDPAIYNRIRSIILPIAAYKPIDSNSSVLIFIKQHCYTWFKYMFVDCLATDSLLFVWDQYIIHRHIPNFENELFPIIATAIIIALRSFLLKSNQVHDVALILKNKSSIVVASQLKKIIASSFSKYLKNSIEKKSDGPQVPLPQNESSSEPPKPRYDKNPLYDLLNETARALRRLAQSEESRTQVLDEITRNSIFVGKLDLRMARWEVFGRKLDDHEWNALSDEEKQLNSRKIDQITRKRANARYMSQYRQLKAK